MTEEGLRRQLSLIEHDLNKLTNRDLPYLHWFYTVFLLVWFSVLTWHLAGIKERLPPVEVKVVKVEDGK